MSLAIIITSSLSVLANSSPKTQVNQVTDLFSRNIEDKAALERQINNIKTESINNVGNKSALNALPDQDKIQGKTNELSRIEAGDLDDGGSLSTEKEEFDKGDGKSQFLIDHKAPGVIRHKREVELIATKSQTLMNRLTEELRANGIDCRESEVRRELEQQWFIDIEQKEEKEIIYDKFYCEHLRNSYSCKDIVELQCQQFAEQAADFTVMGTDMLYRQTGSAPIKTFDFTGNYGGGGEANRYGGGRVHGFINKRGGSTRDASEITYFVDFDIGTVLSTVNRLELTDLRYGTFVMIRLNGRVVLIGPRGGNNLYLDGHREIVKKGKRKYANVVGKKVRNKHYYPRVRTGTAEFALGHDDIRRNTNGADINLMPYVRQGANRLEIKLISLGANSIRFNLSSSERICLNWQETWREGCTLTITQP